MPFFVGSEFSVKSVFVPAVPRLLTVNTVASSELPSLFYTVQMIPPQTLAMTLFAEMTWLSTQLKLDAGVVYRL